MGDRISNALNLLNDDDISYENRIELIANLKVMKDLIESSPSIKDYDGKINSNDSNKNGENNNENYNNGIIKGDFNKYLNKIKEFKEVQENPNLLKLIFGLQSQVKKISGEGESKSGEVNGVSEQSTDSLLKIRNCEDKDIQTEKLEEEYDKITEKYEREKRVLYKQIDDKTLIINNLTKDVEELTEKNKMLNDKIPFNEKKAFDLNIILENNLRDLRKKLEESQVERLMLEDQNNTYIKSMKDKNTLIAHLEKEIQEIKKNRLGEKSQALVGNLIKKIQGGQKK